MKTGNPRRFLEERAPLDRLGADDPADAPLADHGGRVGAGGEVGEQELHVPGAHFLAVDSVCRAHAALNPPDHLELVVLVVEPRRSAVRIVQVQGHLGDVACRAASGAPEDHVVHLAATQAFGRGLAHRPAERLDEVGLAAAVGADDAG